MGLWQKKAHLAACEPSPYSKEVTDAVRAALVESLSGGNVQQFVKDVVRRMADGHTSVRCCYIVFDVFKIERVYI